ncbi:MAG: 5'-nucleotidase, lipoprotein e(P4) family [Steroidobacteraceae bacterium]
MRDATARRAVILAAIAAVAGCATQASLTATTANTKPCGAARPFAQGGERATLWVRNSSEFRAATEIIYRSAQRALGQALTDAAWSAEPAQTGDLSAMPPAVVMDIDDTVLDNSEPQARMILEGTCPDRFTALWDAWLAERAAPAVPGAVGFIRAARGMKDSQGRPVRIFFVTNRECRPRAAAGSSCPQQDDTLANLRELGIDTPTLADDLMLKGEKPEWPSEKLPRRLEIARGYRIVLNVGDDLGDFLPDVRRASVADRERARCAHRDRWGTRWFMIPNPMYGSWQTVMGPDFEALLAAKPQVVRDCAQP